MRLNRVVVITGLIGYLNQKFGIASIHFIKANTQNHNEFECLE
jgi:hypothetical protein